MSGSCPEPSEITNDKIESKSRAAQDSFRLLDLPGELRNMVYKYALYRDRGLKFVVENRINSQDDGKDLVEAHAVEDRHFQGFAFNPLRLVCRQLYSETRGLLLKNNDDHIHLSCLETDLKTRRVTLNRFVDRCTSYDLAALKKVTIDISGYKYVKNVLTPLKLVKLLQRISRNICARNPNIMVQVRDDWCDRDEYGAYEWLKWAHSLQKGLRNESTTLVSDGIQEGTLMLQVQAYLKSRVEHDPISENCRYMFSSSFPEDNVQQEAEKWHAVNGLPIEDEKIEATIEQSRKAFEDGV